MGFVKHEDLCGPDSLDLIATIPSQGPGIQATVKWCRVCGAVVIDADDYDGRTSPGAFMPMRFPEKTRWIGAKARIKEKDETVTTLGPPFDDGNGGFLVPVLRYLCCTSVPLASLEEV